MALRSVDMIKLLLSEINDVTETKPLFKPEGYDALMDVLSQPENYGISDNSSGSETKSAREETVSEDSDSEHIPEEPDTIHSPETPISSQPDHQKQVSESSVRVPIERLDRFCGYGRRIGRGALDGHAG
ncbi:MAG: hypothetical protein HC887_04055 [Desulfobacteraceae bacterium]|nr:hypothetical protein [Desulfobacteraceae bacterium]